MQWSRYNKLFKSNKHGWLLYNSASNSFLEINDELYGEIVKIKENPDSYDVNQNLSLYFQLLANGVLVEEFADETFRNILKLKRLQHNLDTKKLSLTIAPTRECNFNCIYCYEKERPSIFMTEETETRVISFIKQFKDLKYIRLVWYGGEPLLSFDRICSLSNKINELKIPFNALLVTNGFLLNDEKIGKLTELNINAVQITLDGLNEVHNTRRPLKNGNQTFDIIIKNIEDLVQNWQGHLSIRVNLDQSNKHDYHLVHKEIFERLNSLPLKASFSVYPGIINDCNELHPDASCLFNKEDEAKFTLDQFSNYGITDLRLFPKISYGCCDAAFRQGYVIGPEGELYKCWHDIGREDRIIGKLDNEDLGNLGIVANYMVAASYLNDQQCLDCFCFPICDGGCPNVRFNNYFDKAKTVEKSCYRFKNYVEDILEMYYTKKKEKKNELEL
ncbi:MAG: radical SAM protein [Candidatus Margulisiibacteriota bacterium]|jgi:uncharacterized protein